MFNSHTGRLAAMNADHRAGRVLALRQLDKVWKRERNLTKLCKAFQKEADKNILKFFDKYLPLMSKLENAGVDMNVKGVIGTTTITPDQLALKMDERTLGVAPVVMPRTKDKQTRQAQMRARIKLHEHDTDEDD